MFDPQVFAAEQLATLREETPARYRYQLEFFRDHWTSESTFESSYDEADGELHTVHRVRCDQFARETRTCLAHGRQPQVCSGFPWYDRKPTDEASEPIRRSLSPRCSYNADVPGRRMLPIVEVRTP